MTDGALWLLLYLLIGAGIGVLKAARERGEADRVAAISACLFAWPIVVLSSLSVYLQPHLYPHLQPEKEEPSAKGEVHPTPLRPDPTDTTRATRD